MRQGVPPIHTMSTIGMMVLVVVLPNTIVFMMKRVHMTMTKIMVVGVSG